MTGSIKSWRWYWMSAAVFLIGISSTFMLFWIERLGEEQRKNNARVDAFMNAQIYTAMFHLHLEEYLRGESSGDIESVLREMERSRRLVEASLRGGRDEFGRTLAPLGSAEHRAQGEEIQALLSELERLALERVRGGSEADRERRFHNVFMTTLSKASVLERALEADNSRYLSQSRRLSEGILYVWVLIVVAATAGLWIGERGRRRAGEELQRANKELVEHRERLAGLVEMRTAELRRSIESLNAEVAERRQAEGALKETERQNRQLSSRLLTAQEIERKRISMELHDELGQALNGIKLQIRAIERRMGDSQKEGREDCEKLLVYMDQVIEDVRRLSLDLSPTVLEDLGLTSALQWLAGGFRQKTGTKVASDIGEIDRLIPEEQWIVVYRVVQEALTNIARHARAENVTIEIRRRDDQVSVSIEDDGRGFDPRRAAAKAATERGLGLTTMAERVRTLGGALDLRSQEGTGTRISFSIPVEEGGD